MYTPHWTVTASGGSGGSIYVTTGTLAGAGRFGADGASGPYYGVGGGGGRVAVYYGEGSTYTGFTSSTASAGSARAGYPVAQDGTVAFFDTSIPSYRMSIFQRFAFDEDQSVHYGGISLSDSALLEVGGGSRITLEQDLSVADHSTVLLHGKNVDRQYGGRWAGTGVKIHAANIMVDETSKINADGEGYMTRQGPGAGPGGNDGGSYGGRGANNSGPTYGSPSTPTDLGSGGGGDGSGGSGDGWSRGGGAIRLDVIDTLTMDGEITADGIFFSSGWTVRASGGSGGSVYISARNVAGSGTITANGGLHPYYGSFGGGGRIAIHYWGGMSLPRANVTASAGGPPAGDGTVVINHGEPLYNWADSGGSLFHGTKKLAWEALAVNPNGMTVEIIASTGGASRSLVSGLPARGEFDWNTRDFSDGLYELRAVFRNGLAEIAGEAVRNILLNNSVAWHSGWIEANETWHAGTVHVVESDVTVRPGVTLTIEPGAIIKFAEGTGIIVDGGILDAPGTADQPILFTSLTDDTAGGDTNLDGTRSMPIPGYWSGLSVTGGGQLNLTDYDAVRYIQTTHSGTITAGEVWFGTHVHHVTGDLTIDSGRSLTIQPGAVVKFDALKGIVVQPGGSLVARGTVAKPIYFTSIRDDSVGGDTNRDGNSTTPAAGDWHWIYINGGEAEFDHVHVTYGGGTSSGSWDSTGMIKSVNGATVTISNSQLRESFFDGVLAWGGPVTITNSILTGIDRAICAHPGSPVQVINCTLDDNRIGLLIHGGTMDVANTIVTHSLESGIQYDFGTLASVRYSNVWTPPGSGSVNYRNTPDRTGTNGNISVNPLYKNRGQGNYRLKHRSPCIDAADGTTAPETDFMGAPRYDDPRTADTGVKMSGSDAFPDMGAFEFVETADSDVDLVVKWVNGPTEVLAGEEVEITWQIANIGRGLAVGPWYDRISLVTDVPMRGVTEITTGESLSSATLGPGGAAVFTAKVRVPGGTEGTWRWQVHANSRGEMFEGKNWTNNTSPLGSAARLSLTGLIIGTPQDGSYAGVGLPEWWKVAQEAGQHLLVAVDSAASSARVRVYAGYGSAPTMADFDLRSFDSKTPDPRLVIPAPTEARMVYLMADPESLSGTERGYSIRTTVVGFALSGIGISQGGNVGKVTIPLIGSGFNSGLEAALHSSGSGEIDAETVFVQDSANALATFNLSGRATGTYDVIARQDGVESRLPGAFTVSKGAGAKLKARVILPERVRVGRPFKGIVEVANTGDADMPVPLMILQGTTDHPVWAVGESQSNAKAILQFLPISPGELSGGAFRPGQAFSMTFHSITSTSGAINYQIFYEPGDSKDAVDWTAFKTELRPADPPAHWDEAWAAMVGKIGTTYGDYIMALVSTHDEATSCGLDLQNLYSLIDYMITKEITLLPGASVSGKVYLGDLSHPLKMAAVTLVDEGLKAAFSAKSLCDGTFGLRDVASAMYTLSVRNYIPNPWGKVTIAMGSSITGLEVIVNPGSQLAGRIVNSETGEPIPEAVVSVTDGQAILHDTQSGRDGRYMLPDLPPGTLYVDVLAEGFISPVTQQVILVSDETTPLSFALSPGGTIAGRITGLSGSPVSGATVEAILTTEIESREAITSSDGTYAIPGLAAGTYRVVASATGFGSAVREDIIVWEKAVISGVDITLSASGQIGGTVRDTSTSEAIEGASVTIETLGVFDELSRTDKDGKFALAGVPPGSHTLNITADGYVDEAVAVDLAAGETKNVSVALRRLGSISGYVKDGTGNPIAGVHVLLITPLGVELEVATTIDGYFSFTGLPDGEYALYIVGMDGLYIEVETFTLNTTQNIFTVTQPLTTGLLEGRVLQGGGSPANDVQVLLRHDGEMVASTLTDSLGRYGFLLFQKGPVDVIATSAGVGFQRVQDLAVSHGSKITVPDLTAGSSSLTVSVGSTALGQAAIKDALVAIRPADAGFPPDAVLFGSTNDEGSITFENLSGGGTPYVVEAVASGAAPGRQPVLLNDPGGTVSFDLAKGRTVQGMVLDQDGKPVPWATLNFVDRATEKVYGVKFWLDSVTA